MQYADIKFEPAIGTVPRDARKEAVRRQAAIAVLMRHGLTRAEAEEQYAAGCWRRP
jgi:hypothetical protein